MDLDKTGKCALPWALVLVEISALPWAINFALPWANKLDSRGGITFHRSWLSHESTTCVHGKMRLLPAEPKKLVVSLHGKDRPTLWFPAAALPTLFLAFSLISGLKNGLTMSWCIAKLASVMRFSAQKGVILSLKSGRKCCKSERPHGFLVILCTKWSQMGVPRIGVPEAPEVAIGFPWKMDDHQWW